MAGRSTCSASSYTQLSNRNKPAFGMEAVFQAGYREYARLSEEGGVTANEFVESFVGEERGLRRLALNTVASLPFEQGPVVTHDATLADAERALSSSPSEWLGVTRDGAFAGWVTADDARAAFASGDGLAGATLQLPAAQVEPSSSLRAAMELIMVSNSSVAVVEDDGRFGGVVTLEALRRSLAVDDS